jgi:predicted kinase
MSERVYSTLAERATLLLRGGHGVVVDAVHARPADREAIEQVARAAAVPLIGLWLDAPESVLISRTEARRGDASDADARVVRLQRAQDTGHLTWSRIDASQPTAFVLSSAINRVRDQQDVLNELATDVR